MEEVKLHPADFSRLEKNATIALIGKRRSGKTTWAKTLVNHIYNNGLCNRFVVISGGKDNMAEWKRIVPGMFVHSKHDASAVIKKLVAYQDKKSAYFTSKNMDTPVPYRVTIVIDDCGSDRKFMNSAVIKDLMSNGRHYNVSVVLIVQYINQIPMENRDQMDYIGMLYTANTKGIKKIHDEYVNMCSLKTFERLLSVTTQNRGLCWIDNTKNPTHVNEVVYFTRSDYELSEKPICDDYVRSFARDHFITQAEDKKATIYREPTIDADTDDDNFTYVPSEILNDKMVFKDKEGGLVVQMSSFE